MLIECSLLLRFPWGGEGGMRKGGRALGHCLRWGRGRGRERERERERGESEGMGRGRGETR